MEENLFQFKLQMKFGSLIKFSTFIGFCYGVVLVPITILTNYSRFQEDPTGWWVTLPLLIVATPIVAALNGALFGFLGYPIYKWLTNRVALTYIGRLYIRGQE